MRTLFRGGRIFDGSGADAASGDVVIERDSIVDVGVGLDGDVAVDCTGKTVLPGLFDCHVHVMFSGSLDLVAALNKPFSYQFYEAVVNLRRTLATGITTVRDAGGGGSGRAAGGRGWLDRRAADEDRHLDAEPDRWARGWLDGLRA